MQNWHHCKNFIVALLVTLFAGCQTPAELAKKAEEEKKAELQDKREDEVQDTSFKAFLGNLRKAVNNQDIRTMSTMMTNDFGYSFAPGGDGYGCFKYWDENQLWPELQRVINTRFVPNGDYLAAPPEFVTDPNYRGFRAGIKREKGSFKFAYFVPAQETPMAEPPPQGN